MLWSRSVAREVGVIYDVIPGELAFSVHPNAPYSAKRILTNASKDLFYFTSKDHESYRPYCLDFGPVDLRSVVAFCLKLRSLTRDMCGRKTVYYCQNSPKLISNATFLLGAYLVLVEGKNARDAAAPFERIQVNPTPYTLNPKPQTLNPEP
jgi:hypothetical protein